MSLQCRDQILSRFIQCIGLQQKITDSVWLVFISPGALRTPRILGLVSARLQIERDYLAAFHRVAFDLQGVAVRVSFFSAAGGAGVRRGE